MVRFTFVIRSEEAYWYTQRAKMKMFSEFEIIFAFAVRKRIGIRDERESEKNSNLCFVVPVVVEFEVLTHNFANSSNDTVLVNAEC